MKYSASLKRLPYEDNRIAVLFSGGMGSFLAAYLLKVQGYKNVTLYFNDTLSEDDDLYRFLVECHDWLGYPLVYDADGRDIFQVFIDSRYMANTRVDVCSRVLKRERRQRWAAAEKPYYLAMGIDPWEEDRLIRANTHREQSISRFIDLTYKIPKFVKDGNLWRLIPYLWLAKVYKWVKPSVEEIAEFIEKTPRFISPLIDAQCFDVKLLEEEALAITNIQRPRLYDLDFDHNNCGGWCVKAGLAHYKNLWERLPERYIYFEKKEQEVYDAVPTARPFLRKRLSGKVHYITLKQYREEYLEPNAALPVLKQLQLFEQLGLDMSLTSCNSCAIAS